MPHQVFRLHTSDTDLESRVDWPPIIIAFTAIVVAACMGYYAWGVRADRRAAVVELSAAKKRAAQLDGEHAALIACTEERERQAAECEAVEQTVVKMRGNLTATKAELEHLRKQREQTARRLAAFQDLTARFRKMIDSGKVDVINRNGRMVVQMPAGVLFDPGSADLSRDGELTLMEVAIVLRDLEGRKFMVEGHTDDRPLENAETTSRYRNNWELSTARAVTVVEFLIEARMEPRNLLAAGHGEFDPVGNNNTSGGRQENRRIEIILLPNFDELPAVPDELLGD